MRCRTGAGVSEDSQRPSARHKLTLLATRMVIGELGDIVDILVNNDVQAIIRFVRGDLVSSEDFGHGEGRQLESRTRQMQNGGGVK